MQTLHPPHVRRAALPCFFLVLLLGTLGGCSGGGGGGTTDNPSSAFVFSTASKDRYARVDRMGQPAVATALLQKDPSIQATGPNGSPLNPGATPTLSGQRDAFNRGNPINDIRDFSAMMESGPQKNSLRNIHYKAGPSLRALGYTPCSKELVTPAHSSADIDVTECVNLAFPVILPDVLTFDLNAAPGWPNGRSFDDPVIDRLLAAALLKVTGPNPPHTLRDFEGVLNPKTDDTGTPSPITFPYLRPAQP